MTSTPRRFGLLFKLNLLSIVLIVVSSLGATLFLVRQQIVEEFHTLREQGLAAARIAAEISEYGIFTANRAELGRLAGSIERIPNLSYVVVEDAGGRALVRQRFSGTDPIPVELAARARSGNDAELLAAPAPSYFAEGEMHFAAPIRVGPGVAALAIEPGLTPPPHLGRVQVGMSLAQLRPRMEAFIRTTLLFTLLVILAGTAATLLLTRRIVAPIIELTHVTREVADGNLDRRVETRARDEVRELAESFNAMLTRLRASREDLAGYQRGLETQVAERTRELEEASARAFRLAQHDALTGLPNRLLLIERLRAALASAQRHGRRVAVLFLDLDHFKRINDTVGHDHGDALLQVVAARLAACVRELDTVARLGGDEFIVVVTDMYEQTSLHDVSVVAEKILESLAQSWETEGHSFDVTGSIGISVYPEDGTDPAALIKQADTAMYSAKDAGRSQYRFFTPQMNSLVTQRLALENGLRRALERGELRLAWQPQANLATGTLQGVEALVRWRDAAGHDIEPSRFIPVAEESGLILPLGEWVLRSACAQAKAWADAGHRVRVAVNLSTVQMERQDIAGLVRNVLHETKLDAELLKLEVTESALISNRERVVRAMDDVRSLGVEWLIDDFGTGYSSLAYLTRLPINTIKIDQSFVRGIAINRRDEAVVQVVIALSRALGLDTIAEGVETPEQLAFLAAHQCGGIQGYLLSHPIDTAAMSEMLERGMPELPLPALVNSASTPSTPF